jgi:hypothetical protein
VPFVAFQKKFKPRQLPESKHKATEALRLKVMWTCDSARASGTSEHCPCSLVISEIKVEDKVRINQNKRGREEHEIRYQKGDGRE